MDHRLRALRFGVGDLYFPLSFIHEECDEIWKRWEKIIPRYVGPFEVLQIVGDIAMSWLYPYIYWLFI